VFTGKGSRGEGIKASGVLGCRGFGLGGVGGDPLPSEGVWILHA
jgi:hypothetical protein